VSHWLKANMRMRRAQMMHERVAADHHLKHNGRLQLGLFLKARRPAQAPPHACACLWRRAHDITVASVRSRVARRERERPGTGKQACVPRALQRRPACHPLSRTFTTYSLHKNPVGPGALMQRQLRSARRHI